MEAYTPPTLTESIAMLFDGLRKLMGNEAYRTRTQVPIWLLALLRLQGIRKRWLGYVAKYRAGTLRAAVVGVRKVRPERFGPPAPKPAVRLPWKSGWLLRMVPGTVSTVGVAGYRPWLEHILADPETVAMLAIAPQIGRTLRPLCHMLMVEPAFALPKRKRAARKKVEPEVAVALSPSELWAKNLRWPHVSLARRWPKWVKKRDEELDAFLAERKKREEGG